MQADDDITITSLRAALLRDVQSGISEADKAWNKSPSEAVTLVCRIVGETWSAGFKEPQAQDLCARLDAGLYPWVESKPAFPLLLRLLPFVNNRNRHDPDLR